MKTSEVRIGNTILALMDNGEWESVIVDIRTLIQMEKSEERFKPKLVSKDWLLGVGFKQPGNYKKYNCYSIELGVLDMSLHIIVQGKSGELIHTRSKNLRGDGYHVGSIRTEMDQGIASVHHIQNIYNCITDKELV